MLAEKNKKKSNQKVTTPKSEKVLRKRKISEGGDDDLTQEDIAELMGMPQTPKDKKAKMITPNTDPIKKKKQKEINSPAKETKTPSKENKSPSKETPAKSATKDSVGKKKKRKASESDDGDDVENTTPTKIQEETSSPADKKIKKRRGNKKRNSLNGVTEDEEEEVNGMGELQEQQRKIKEEDNKRNLYVGGFGSKVKEADLKALSSDILEATLKTKFMSKKKGGDECFAYLRFENEETAERNALKLKGRKLKGAELQVEFVGRKNPKFKDLEGKKKSLASNKLDPKRLYITGFDKSSIKEDDLKELLVGATEVSLPVRRADNKYIGYAFVSFEDEAVCKGYFERDLELAGRKLTVCFANKKK